MDSGTKRSSKYCNGTHPVTVSRTRIMLDLSSSDSRVDPEPEMRATPRRQRRGEFGWILSTLDTTQGKFMVSLVNSHSNAIFQR